MKTSNKLNETLIEDDVEVYFAKADTQVALEVANATSPYTIEVRFLGGLNETQKQAFKEAADRWCRIIVGDLPSVTVDGEVVDDLLILAQGKAIDEPGRILGQAGPTHLRPRNAGSAAFIPAKGIMSFDTDDLDEMERQGTLNDVITHEMGHVIGVGTIWSSKSLLRGVGTSNPTFNGPKAMTEYGVLKGQNNPVEVPVENTGGGGTRDSHWREVIFKNELMSGFIGGQGNPISKVTVASLHDLGYEVDINAAEPYNLPNLFSLAESGALVSGEEGVDMGMVLPNIPVTLPGSSLLQ